MGTLGPDKFIALAEETGLVVPLGEWVLLTVCQQIRQWQAAGLPPVRVAVNISARQFREKAFAGKVEKLLADYGLEAASLELELTESMLMHDVEEAIAIMSQLRALDVHLSLDDFGTGYSSLSHLKRFPISVLKLDRSFVREIPQNHGDAMIARAVIDLGHNLNLKVVAEGVEEPAQFAFLHDQRADLAQGFYFSRPITAHDFAALLLQQAMPQFAVSYA